MCRVFLSVQVDHVGRQLLGSLMGEWGLMQQLQGLVGALLIASPAMVEWTEACFKAVEVVQRRGKSPGGGSSVHGGRPGSAGGPGIGLGAAALPAPVSAAKVEQTAVGPDELDVFELEVLLQVSGCCSQLHVATTEADAVVPLMLVGIRVHLPEAQSSSSKPGNILSVTLVMSCPVAAGMFSTLYHNFPTECLL